MNLVATALLLMLSQSALAQECHEQTVTQVVNGHLQTNTVVVCDEATSSSSGSQQVNEQAVTEIDLYENCIRELDPLLDPVAFCPEPDDDAEVDLTPGMVASALQIIPLPPSQLQVQPANGRTLVNFETNFFTDAAPFDRTVTLLGQRVDLHIVPSGFGWRFGDGEALSTTDAGAPYPDLRITHAYQRKGGVAPSVDTTYTATYRVNGGPWADVPGSVTVPGLPVGLEVLTATPVLVGY
jgi:hypothetical protein